MMAAATLVRNDRIQLFVQTVISSIAIVANLILLVAIKNRTPSVMRAFSIFLTNTAIVDTIAAITLCLSCTRIIIMPGGATVLLFLGPCTRISAEFCLVCHCIQTCLSNHSTWLILLTFCYRLIALRGKNNWFHTKIFSAIWIACGASLLLTTISTYNYYSIGENVPLNISKKFAIDKYTLKEFPGFNSLRVIAYMLPVAAANPIFIMVIFLLRRHLIRKIILNSRVERDYHNKIMKILTYQSMLPLGSTVSIAIWALDDYLPLSSEFSQRALMMGVTFICLVSPIINLIFIPPYRRMFSFRSTANTITAR